MPPKVKEPTKPTFHPIITLATATVLNDKQESVLIPKVLCGEDLKSIPECMACDYHDGIPNQFTVACKKPEADGDNKK